MHSIVFNAEIEINSVINPLPKTVPVPHGSGSGSEINGTVPYGSDSGSGSEKNGTVPYGSDSGSD
jgi:hypothetical protein